MQGTDFQDVSLKNKLSIKNPFLPLGGQEKQKVHYFRPHRHLERDGLGVHRVLKVPEAGLCAEILSPAGETQVIFLGIGHWTYPNFQVISLVFGYLSKRSHSRKGMPLCA